MKKVLVVSQVIPQWYVDLLTQALGEDADIDIITGSQVRGNTIESPKHDPRSLKSRLICWWKHYRFVMSWAKRNRDTRYDLIFAISNPPINSFLGLKLKKLFHAPFVYMNWDLYPQVIEESISNPIVLMVCKGWHCWNSRNYPKIDRMLTIGTVMAESLVKPLKTPIPVEVLPIAVDIDYLKPIPKEENPFCIENDLMDKFVVLYSGKMGLGHNIELILEAAEKLKKNRNICFVFIGDGPKYPVVENFIKEHHSENIKLFPLQPDNVFPYSMACGDVGIVTQEAKMAHLFMPSKTYSMMACGQVIVGICTEHDDLHRLLSDGCFGRAVTKASAEELALQIEELYNNTMQVIEMKVAARKAIEDTYSNKCIQGSYRRLFEMIEE